jgi:adenosylcobinamide kinase/adenosylcobinamide-phosphate guanylyltransferase
MQERDRKTVTLVLGGARSGKSRWAQEFAAGFERVAYLATAQALDAEMHEKIRRHQEDRPKHWRTFEEPLELARVVAAHASQFDIILLDCLTFYVANLLQADETEPGAIEPRMQSLLGVLGEAPVSMILVSNEVGCGVVPPYPAGRSYRDALGELNQRVAAIADNVVLMVAGLPLALKGNIGARP